MEAFTGQALRTGRGGQLRACRSHASLHPFIHQSIRYIPRSIVLFIAPLVLMLQGKGIVAFTKR